MKSQAHKLTDHFAKFEHLIPEEHKQPLTDGKEVWDRQPLYYSEKYDLYFAGLDGSFAVKYDGRSKKMECVLPFEWVPPSSVSKTYMCINSTTRLTGKQEKALMHQIVAEAHYGPRPNNLHTMHKDNDGTNNFFKNLKYGTPKENCEQKCGDGTAAKKLKSLDVIKVFHFYNEMGMTQCEIAQALNVTQHVINYILNKKIWAHISDKYKLSIDKVAHKQAKAAKEQRTAPIDNIIAELNGIEQSQAPQKPELCYAVDNDDCLF